eukprot:scaffold50225_cov57-Phaeocystis_antarctica.AAC.1
MASLCVVRLCRVRIRDAPLSNRRLGVGRSRRLALLLALAILALALAAALTAALTAVVIVREAAAAAAAALAFLEGVASAAATATAAAATAAAVAAAAAAALALASVVALALAHALALAVHWIIFERVLLALACTGLDACFGGLFQPLQLLLYAELHRHDEQLVPERYPFVTTAYNRASTRVSAKDWRGINR